MVALYKLLPTLLMGGLITCGAALADEKDQINPDRPDFTEGSETVGKGHFQIETGIQQERNKNNGSKDRLFTTPTLLRFGVSEDLELRLETDGHSVQRSQDLGTGVTQSTRGTADVSLGVKWHVMDAKDGSPSIGLLLHADLDSGTRDFRGQGIRPSLRAAEEWELPNDYSLAAMQGFIRDKNDSGQRFTGGILSLSLGKRWNEKWSGYAELALPQIAATKNGGTSASFNVGAMYLVNDDLQLDAGIFRGLNKHTPDLAYGAGLSIRF